MVVRNAEKFDVGDKVKVKLVGADPYKGFVDFEGRN
jgi:predicted RNA-binding protein with RPS1 domain